MVAPADDARVGAARELAASTDRELRRALPAVLPFALGIAVALQRRLPTRSLGAWLGLVTLAVVLSHVHHRRVERDLAAGLSVRAWTRRAVVQAIRFNAAWSLLAPLALAARNAGAMNVAIVVALALTALTLSSTAFRSVYLAGTLTQAVPTLASAIAFGGDQRLVGFIGAIYVVLVVTIHGRLTRAMWVATELKHVNAALVEELAGEHERVRESNDRLLDANTMLRHQAEHDALTGLANRSLALDTLSQAVRTVAPGSCVGVLFCDLDGFKPVNDSFGHEVGDHLLVATARRLRAAVGGDDLVARLGGDEFVIVAAGLARPADAVGIAERVLKVMSEPVAVDGHALRVGMSIGVVAVDSPRSALELIRLADGALYTAKQHGRGRVEVAQLPVRVR